jgi:group I intron endonuclease
VSRRSRFSQHRHHLRQSTHKNCELQKDWNTYGEDSFVFDVIEEVSEELRYEREQYLMEINKNSKGIYNILPLAGTPRGRTYRETTLRRMSEAAKGRVISEEHKEALRKSRLGSRIPEETRKKMSESQRKRAASVDEWTHSKLTSGDVWDALKMHKAGDSVPYIAESLGVSRTTIFNITRGKSWRNIYEKFHSINETEAM